MPSDIPPVRPIRPAASVDGEPVSPPTGEARASSAIPNPTVRRFWHREEDPRDADAPPRRRMVGQSVNWAIAVGIMVGAAIAFERVLVMMETPETAPQAGVGPGSPIAALSGRGEGVPTALPTLAPQPALMRAYGSGAVARAEEAARRYGQISGQAVACGIQQPAWANAVSTVLADDITDRSPTFDEDTTIPVLMQDHVRAHFRIGQMMAGQSIANLGRDAVCSEIPRAVDYLGALRMERAARIKTEWDARFRPEPVPEFNPKSAAGVRPGSADE